ncbi:MAG TPA: hypothetical protein VI547_10580 [Anaerolineales bacterium]|nr:hypothetical protein [Anaerolineales bacterium]
MDNKLFTALEIAVIGGLIIFVMWLGGVFNSESSPTPTPTRPLNPTQPPRATATPRGTLRPTSVPSPTPTTPPLVQASGFIAFNSTRDGNTEIYVMDAVGTNPRNLTTNPAEDYLLGWSPDGTRLAFFSTRTQWLELYVMDADGSNVIQLTDSKESNTAYSYPASWSPDGEFILAARSTPWYMGESIRRMALDLIHSDGTGVKNIYFDEGPFPFWSATLSPDGKYVAMTRQGEQGYGVYAAKLTADGLMAPQLVRQACYSFTWLTNSNRLTCESGNMLVTVNPDSGAKEGLQVEGANYSNRFAWSPDGQLLLTLQRTFEEANGSPSLSFVAYAAEGNTQRIVLSDNDIEADTTLAWSWSSDNQWIALTSSRFGPREIFAINIYDPNSLRQLTPSLGGETFNPQWQPSP